MEKNRSKIFVTAESREEADKLFNGLSVVGMFRDKYGIEWMVDFDPNNKGQ